MDPATSNYKKVAYQKHMYYVDGCLIVKGIDSYERDKLSTKTLTISLTQLHTLINNFYDIEHAYILQSVDFHKKPLLKTRRKWLSELHYHKLLQTATYSIHAGKFTNQTIQQPTIEVYVLFTFGGYLYVEMPQYTDYEEYVVLDSYIRKIIRELTPENERGKLKRSKKRVIKGDLLN